MNMARLIDADKLLEALGIFKDYEHGNPHFMNGIETARELVNNAPTVDAKPVKTAQLIRETDRERHWHCSRCGKVFGLVGLMHKYCPECGARLMGGGRDAG